MSCAARVLYCKAFPYEEQEMAACAKPWEGVVEDERVEARVADFQLALDCLFMGIAASQRNEDLRGEQKRWGEVKRGAHGDAGLKCIAVAFSFHRTFSSIPTSVCMDTLLHAHTQCASSLPTLTVLVLHLSKCVEGKNCDLESNFKWEIKREIESWGYAAYWWHYIRLDRHSTDLQEKCVMYNLLMKPCCHQLAPLVFSRESRPQWAASRSARVLIKEHPGSIQYVQ